MYTTTITRDSLVLPLWYRIQRIIHRAPSKRKFSHMIALHVVTLCTLMYVTRYLMYILYKEHCTKNTIQRTLYIVQFILYTVQCTLYNVHCTYCTLYILYTVHIVHCTYCTLYILYTVHTVHCTYCTLYILYTVHIVHCTYCTMYTVQVILYNK